MMMKNMIVILTFSPTKAFSQSVDREFEISWLEYGRGVWLLLKMLSCGSKRRYVVPYGVVLIIVLDCPYQLLSDDQIQMRNLRKYATIK